MISIFLQFHEKKRQTYHQTFSLFCVKWKKRRKLSWGLVSSYVVPYNIGRYSVNQRGSDVCRWQASDFFGNNFDKMQLFLRLFCLYRK